MNGFWSHWGPDFVAAAGAAFVAGAGGALTTIGPWYRDLKKPSWNPPNWAFAPAWTLIFVLAATAAVMGWYRTTDNMQATILILLFAFNGVCNILWSALFFYLRRPDWALREMIFLWLSIAAPMLFLKLHAGNAWLLLLPYLLWVSFAGFLNYTIVQLNQPFKAA